MSGADMAGPVLWGWKPGTVTEPIRLGEATRANRDHYERGGWFTDTRAPGASPARFRAWVAAMTSQTAAWGKAGRLRYDDDGRPVVEIATDLACGRSWNDALITSRTPPPSARCPYEYEHGTAGYPETFNYYTTTDGLSRRPRRGRVGRSAR